MADLRRNRGFPWLSAIGRLKPGVSLSQARGESEAVYRQIASVPQNRPSRLRVEPASRGFAGLGERVGIQFQILAGTVVVVLLVVWANVATLLLARGTARQREVAVRQALGCSKARLLRQFLLEGLLMACVAGAIGIAMAPGLARAFMWINLDLSIDFNVLVFGIAISVLTAAAFSLAPALRLSRAPIELALKSASWGSTGRREMAVRWVTALQVALSVILVTASFLFGRSLIGLHTVDTGYDREHIVSVTLNPRLAGYRDDAAQARLGERLVERLSAMPGVKSASVGLGAVLMGCSRASVVSMEGRVAQPDDPSIWINPVSPNYFDTAGVPLVMGRSFGPADRPGSTHVAVVTDALARFYFPGQNPLGKRFTEQSGTDPIEIVGVARDVKFVSPRDAPIRMAFFRWHSFRVLSVTLRSGPKGQPVDLSRRYARRFSKWTPSYFCWGPIRSRTFWIASSLAMCCSAVRADCLA